MKYIAKATDTKTYVNTIVIRDKNIYNGFFSLSPSMSFITPIEKRTIPYIENKNEMGFKTLAALMTEARKKGVLEYTAKHKEK